MSLFHVFQSTILFYPHSTCFKILSPNLVGYTFVGFTCIPSYIHSLFPPKKIKDWVPLFSISTIILGFESFGFSRAFSIMGFFLFLFLGFPLCFHCYLHLDSTSLSFLFYLRSLSFRFSVKKLEEGDQITTSYKCPFLFVYCKVHDRSS